MNYYSQHHHQVFLLLLVLILSSTLTFCCFLLICTDWREVMRLLPVNPCGINLSALPRLLINIFTPSPQTGIIAVSLSVVITSETLSLNSAADTKDHNFPCFLDYLTQFSYPHLYFPLHEKRVSGPCPWSCIDSRATLNAGMLNMHNLGFSTALRNVFKTLSYLTVLDLKNPLYPLSCCFHVFHIADRNLIHQEGQYDCCCWMVKDWTHLFSNTDLSF